jgi:hypothetical protein
MMKTLLKAFSISSLVGLSMMFLFQNCAPPSESTVGKKESSSSGDLPFALDVAMDTFTYLSCSQMGTQYDPNVFFSYRVGSVNPSSGLKFGTSFIKWAQDSKLSGNALAKQIVNSKTHKDLNLILSIKERSDLQEGIETPNGIQSQDQAYHSKYPDLADLETISSLSEGDLKSSLNELGGEFIHLSLSFNDDNDHLLDSLSQSGSTNMLTIGFNQPSNDSSEKSPYAILGLANSPAAYGTGFRLQTSKPTPSGGAVANSSIPNRVITKVIQYNLADPSLKTVSAGWTCPSQLSFRVVPLSLWQEAGCVDPGSIDNDSLSGSNSDYFLLNSLLNSDSDSNWKFDFENRCAFPPSGKGNCYSNQASPSIEWDLTKACGSSGNKACTHWLTLCKR